MVAHIGIARARRHAIDPAAGGQQRRFRHAPAAPRCHRVAGPVAFDFADWQIGIVKNLVAHRVVERDDSVEVVIALDMGIGEFDHAWMIAVHEMAGAQVYISIAVFHETKYFCGRKIRH